MEALDWRWFKYASLQGINRGSVMTYKMTWQFQQANGASFNEVYYTDKSTAAESLQSDRLQITRLALLHRTCRLVAIRASNVSRLRDTATDTRNNSGTAPLALGGPLAPGDAAVCTLGGVAGGSRRLWLRGIPSAWQVRSLTTGQDTPPGDFRDALRDFFTALKKNAYGILRIQQSTGADAYAPNNIVRVDGSTADGITTITCAGPILFTIADSVIIARANKKNVPGLNGKWKLVNANNPPGTFKINYRVPEDQSIETSGGYVKKLSYLPVSIIDPASSGFHHYGTRTTENPTTHSRGARRAARLRLSR